MTPNAVANISRTTKEPGTTGSLETWRNPCTSQAGATGSDIRAITPTPIGKTRITTRPTANRSSTGPTRRL